VKVAPEWSASEGRFGQPTRCSRGRRSPTRPAVWRKSRNRQRRQDRRREKPSLPRPRSPGETTP